MWGYVWDPPPPHTHKACDALKYKIKFICWQPQAEQQCYMLGWPDSRLVMLGPLTAAGSVWA